MDHIAASTPLICLDHRGFRIRGRVCVITAKPNPSGSGVRRLSAYVGPSRPDACTRPITAQSDSNSSLVRRPAVLKQTDSAGETARALKNLSVVKQQKTRRSGFLS